MPGLSSSPEVSLKTSKEEVPQVYQCLFLTLLAKYTSKAAQAYKLAIDKHVTNPGQQIRDFCDDVASSNDILSESKPLAVERGFYASEYCEKAYHYLLLGEHLKSPRREEFKK